MRNTKRTRIADLTVAGYELSEEHLQLAAGGQTAPVVTATAYATYRADGRLKDILQDDL